ncbi:DDE-type integrase/transposase/recombinase [Candidatus Saccharibacteria bacterium]|nr:MAG: DDE-type integrase/transposase/recombinase [Candidatus Saccharibacteria bacterium]
MAYSINPNLPKARALAMRLLVCEGIPLQIVANRCGVHRTTIWRWKQKWDKLNEHVQFDNPNRPARVYSKANHLLRCTWLIPTYTSRPHTSPQAIGEQLMTRILELRHRLKRCAEVVWYHLTRVGDAYGTAIVSLSSVRRILRRHYCFDGARKKRVRPDNPRRPQATGPGELVQTDTIHHVDPHSGKRLYYYTVIDLFTRMTYVILATRLSPGLAARAVLEAQDQWGFTISMVQADNGPEYGRYFEQVLRSRGITTRHSRLHRPNDNAHIERYNRTIQTECIGYYWRRSVPLQSQRDKLTAYLDYYNTKRVHLGIQMQVPAAMLQRS